MRGARAMWDKTIRLINRTVENVTAVALMTMVIVVFWQIISRVIFSSSFPWTEELSRYLMIWITLLGASIAFQYGAHIGVEVLVMKLNRKLRNAVQIIASLCCLALFAILIVKGIEIVGKSMVQKSPAMTLPMGYAYLIMPISGVLMTLNLLDVTIKSVRAKEAKKE